VTGWHGRNFASIVINVDDRLARLLRLLDSRTLARLAANLLISALERISGNPDCARKHRVTLLSDFLQRWPQPRRLCAGLRRHPDCLAQIGFEALDFVGRLLAHPLLSEVPRIAKVAKQISHFGSDVSPSLSDLPSLEIVGAGGSGVQWV
jgi:hypothetical protein